jgi:hypothetical protein
MIPASLRLCCTLRVLGDFMLNSTDIISDKYVPYSREQKHVLLFRKSTLRGCYKSRHVTKRDMSVFEYLNFKVVTTQ